MAEGAKSPSESLQFHWVNGKYEYPPTTLILTAPIAMLSWGLASALWIILTAGSVVLAGFLMWKSAKHGTEVISGGLVALLLASSFPLLVIGNAAGIAISLCVIAAWCLLSERWMLVGVVLLAISLAMKPHDSGFVWLYFF